LKIASLVCLLIVLAIASPASAGFTFFMTADTHYGLDLFFLDEPSNKVTIDAMNALPGTPYPASIGGVVGTPKGVLVAGDLTDTSIPANFYGVHVPGLERQGFNDDYAVDGSGRLNYPVYEGYGNHDVDNTDYSYTLQGIQERNLVRPGIGNVSANGLHYSWDWEGVHFVNLNIYAGGDNNRARGSLQFLIDDLAANVGDSNRPVVLMQHFGMDSFSSQSQWWTAAERNALASAIDGYNILGIFHGHLHTTSKYTWNGYDVFMGSAAKDGNFLVARIDNGKMDVVSREDNRWGFAFSKNYVVPEPSSLALLTVGSGGLLLLAKRCRRSIEPLAA